MKNRLYQAAIADSKSDLEKILPSKNFFEVNLSIRRLH